MPDKRKTAFIIITILFPLIIIILFELTLRLFNYGGNTDLFIKDTTNPNRYILNSNFMQRYFFKEGINPPNPRSQSFSVNKPQNTFRIFCLGASTTQGVPYPLHAAFPAQLDSLLEYANPEYDFEVINCGITAVTSHTVLDMAREIINNYQPDLLVVYSGHNEFYGIFGSASQTALFENRTMIQILLQLQRLKTVLFLRNTLISLFGETVSSENVTDPNTLMGTLAKDAQIPFDSNTFKNTTDIFKGNIEELVNVSNENNVPLLLCTLVDNLKMAPFESGFSSKRSQLKKEINELVIHGQKLLADGKPDSALKYLNKAFELDSSYAKTEFLLGKLFLQKHNPQTALIHFKKARDYDLIRFRAPSYFNRVIKNIAEEKNIPFVDLENIFEQKSSDKIPGYDLILEHIHPNYFGYFLMARSIAKEIEKAGLLPLKISNFSEQDSVLLSRFSNLTPLSHEVVNMGVLKLQQNWPFTEEQRSTYKLVGSQLTEKLARDYIFNQKKCKYLSLI